MVHVEKVKLLEWVPALRGLTVPGKDCHRLAGLVLEQTLHTVLSLFKREFQPPKELQQTASAVTLPSRNA